MSTESTKASVRAFFESIDAAQNMSPLDTLASPGYVAHFSGAPDMNREGMKGFGNVFFAACPGLRHRVEQLVAEGDFVACRLVINGRQSQPFMMPSGTLPTSNKSFEMPVINMFRFADGKVTEHWAAFDMLGFLQQLGAIPA
jgi:predicted ester cyclase